MSSSRHDSGSRSRRIARSGRPALALGSILVAACLAFPQSADAWSDQTLVAFAESSASIAPPDLMRILKRHESDYRRGLKTRYTQRTHENLRAHLVREVDRAVSMIREHRPFSEISRQLGVVAHFVALANEPIDSSASWAGDYRRYIETAHPRFAVVFYGFEESVQDSVSLDRYLRESLARRAESSQVVAREYKRIGKRSGVGVFDDRSAAFGIAAASYSRALSDMAVVLRHIWLEAGGTDTRRDLPQRND